MWHRRSSYPDRSMRGRRHRLLPPVVVKVEVGVEEEEDKKEEIQIDVVPSVALTERPRT